MACHTSMERRTSQLQKEKIHLKFYWVWTELLPFKAMSLNLKMRNWSETLSEFFSSSLLVPISHPKVHGFSNGFFALEAGIFCFQVMCNMT